VNFIRDVFCRTKFLQLGCTPKSTSSIGKYLEISACQPECALLEKNSEPHEQPQPEENGLNQGEPASAVRSDEYAHQATDIFTSTEIPHEFWLEVFSIGNDSNGSVAAKAAIKQLVLLSSA
jgi:hypothetical protein